MRYYECVFIARQDVSVAQVDTITDEMCSIITEHKGSVHKREYWGLKNLAYRIKKNRKGHYVMLNVEADAPTMAELDRKLGLNEDVIRSLIIKLDAIDPEPSIMMQNKSDWQATDEAAAS